MLDNVVVLTIMYCALIIVVGIPLLYFSLLYAAKDRIRSKAVKTEIVNMLCHDYTADCWCVLLLLLLLLLPLLLLLLRCCYHFSGLE